MSELLEDLRQKVKPLILRIRTEKKLRFNAIALLIGADLELFYKWRSGKAFPNDFEIESVVEKLEKLLTKSPAELKKEYESLIKHNKVEEHKNGYETKKYVSIFFEPGEKTIAYTGKKKVGDITWVKGKKAIIAYQIDSTQYGDADGLIYMNDAGLEPYIKSGWLVAIKKINKADWRLGYCYYIIDNTDHVFSRRLFEGKEEKKVKFVSGDENRYPAFDFDLDKIVALFRVEKVTFKPE